MGAAAKVRMSYGEYLAAEERGEVKHEYLRGEVWERGEAFGMAGGTPEHSRLAMSFGRLLGNALLGRPCAVLSSDARLRVVATDRSTYPDLSVVCGRIEAAPDDPHAIVNPVVIVEVLSTSTVAEDRGDKFAHCRRIPSLREYVLVSQQSQRIEVYRRDGDFWVLAEFGPGQSARLPSLDLGIAVDEVYANPLTAPDGEDRSSPKG